MNFEQQVDSYISENREAIIDLIKRVVAAPSVNAEPSADNAPFGKGVRAALDIMLEAAENFGLQTIDCEGYFGFAQLVGKREEYLATLAHLDVVPVGEGWDNDPFTVVERKGYLIGRGVGDNKGPAVLSLFALNFFKDRPITFSMRSIFGCDEETAMTDMERYNALYEPPFFAFTPDADFPVGYGEKTIIDGYFVGKKNDSSAIIELCGSGASNIIPSTACALVHCDRELLSTEQVTVSKEEECYRLVAHAQGGHSAYPWTTTNAIDFLMDFIISNDICGSDELTVVKAIKTLSSDCYGKKIGIDLELPFFSPLTIAPTMLKIADGQIHTTINIRAPFGCVCEDVEEALQALATKTKQEFVLERVSYGLFTEPHSKPIRALCEVYNTCVGKEVAPVTINGGTYARKLDNCVSFGPTDHEEKLPEFAGGPHQPNEGIAIETLMFALKVYILSLQRLQEDLA